LSNRCDAIVDQKGIKFESQSEWGRKWEKKVVTYAMLRDSEDIPGVADERIGLNLSMTTWDIEILLKLQVVKKSQNPDITIEFKTKDEEGYFKDHPGVLAFAYFPGQGAVSGIIIFNEEYRWSLDGKDVKITNQAGQEIMAKTYNIITVLIHEIGHSIGLTHSESANSQDVMDPYYSGMLDLSDEDMYRIRKIYGIRMFRWFRYKWIKNWLYHRKRRY